MYIGIMQVWFEIANGQILLVFDRIICPPHNSGGVLLIRVFIFQMGKQTMGIPCHALQYRSDNKLYKLQTPHCPIVRPVKYDEYDLDLYPSGTNAIVAVISYTVC